MGQSTGKRPFWMHQVVEYILGVLVVASGTQSPTPVVPATLGGLVLVYAASTKSSVAAFRVLPRALHRVGDPIVCAVLVVGAIQPWVDVDVGARFVLIGVSVVYLFVWWQSDYSEHVSRRDRKAAAAARSETPARHAQPAQADQPAAADGAGPASTDRSTEVGRMLGRAVGLGVTAARRAKRSR